MPPALLAKFLQEIVVGNDNVHIPKTAEGIGTLHANLGGIHQENPLFCLTQDGLFQDCLLVHAAGRSFSGLPPRPRRSRILSFHNSW